MVQKSVTQRIRITKRGKIMRRAMALGHSKSNKSQVQILRKRKSRELNISEKILSKYF
ncbi:MAG: hypothetical protein UY32_C0013G0038 [Candidatus Jorgensenbacteria bacterium GW2011_GWC1_48_8]|uniref:50S ribosomal protein L35 n=1 Tax=Candidatus Jorgensenbacteria bacterium GW2011_GWC1_48_8 TaxID=1618666 RepID=A0A0G1UXP9_9BACT|nr:MAG: hypothetical protein UY32_C0013G0038 [Candidatus Jorgensenbacteria bacterium GW2011_GWC1_48_8]